MSTYFMLTLAALFVAVALVSGLVASRLLSAASVPRRRLRATRRPAPALVLEPAAMLDVPTPGWQRLSRLVPKSPQEMSRVRRRLANAGFHKPSAAVLFALAEIAAPIALGGGAALAAGLGTSRGMMLAIGGALLGYLLPGLVLDHVTRARRHQVQNGLPDVLDLLVVCLEAGSSLDQAVVKAGEDLEITYPALAEELRLLNTETRAGKPRLEAFENLAKRTQVDDVRALVAMLKQTDRFGTSVAQALRTLAGTMRTKRRQRAEERAAKLGVKLVFPLVFCLFPALFAVALGPAVIQFVRVFMPLASRGR